METDPRFTVQDIYIPVRQLCSKNKVCPDIARYIMTYVKDEYMLQINTKRLIEKIHKNCTTFHVSDLVYNNMKLNDIKKLVDENHNGCLTFSHYCCQGKGIMYRSNYNNKQLVFAI
jgi:DTW domain-containing protein YfiP